MKIWQDSIIVVQLGNRAKIFVQNIGFLSGDSDLRRESRKRDRLQQIFFRTKTETAEKKFKAQRNKFNNLKKQAKQRFYDNITTNSYLPCRNARLCYIKKCFSKV
jgi:hypothetical protein